MSKAPFFSVVVPTYNHSHFLKSSIGSVLQQSFASFEIIVVNNYSEDETVSVLNAMQDQRIRLINFRNQGVIGASRNLGIRESTGEFVAFLDSDDSWDSRKLEVVHSILTGQPDVDLVCHNENLIMQGRPSKVLKYGPTAASLFESLLFNGSCLSTSATTVRRSKLFEANLFCELPEVVTAEDYDMWLRLAKICNCRFIDDVLGNFLVHPQSTSGDPERHSRSVMNVVEAHLKAEYQNPGPGVLRRIRKRRGRILFGVARRLQQRRAFSKSLHYYLMAFRQDPANPKVYPGMLSAMLRIAH